MSANISYKIGKEFKSPLFGKPYIQYQLIQEFDYFDYNINTCWGETVRRSRVIFKSKDFYQVSKFLGELKEGK